MKRYIISAVWIGFLAAFILIGMPYASFHGDEESMLYDSHDYATLFLEQNPAALLVIPPVDTELEYLRLADSSTDRYTIGLAWHLAGYTAADLPTSNFNWSTDYYGNLALGLIPPQPLMVVMRLPSTIFLILSVLVIFLIGYHIGGLPMAFFVSGLYAFNPIILLNGRRALQEGSLLFFGMFTILLGLIISKRRERGQPIPLLLWVGLTLSGALTLVSKNNGFIYMATAYLWIFLPQIMRPRLRALISSGFKLAICAGVTIGLFIAFSPGLWSSPLARLKDMGTVRLAAMSGQMHDDSSEAPSSMSRRVTDILTQPFLRPAAHYDGTYTNLLNAQRDLIAAYDASPISGIHFGLALGLPLTVLAIFGLIANFVPNVRPYRSPSISLGLPIWLVINISVLLWLPLPWQRYFLSLIPVMTIFAAVGLWSVVGLVRSTRRSRQPLTVAAAA